MVPAPCQEGSRGGRWRGNALAAGLSVFKQGVKNSGKIFGAALNVCGESVDGLQGDVAILLFAGALREAEERSDGECVGGGQSVVGGIFHAREKFIAQGAVKKKPPRWGSANSRISVSASSRERFLAIVPGRLVEVVESIRSMRPLSSEA